MERAVPDVALASVVPSRGKAHPLELSWTAAGGSRPLPVRAIRPHRSQRGQLTLADLLDPNLRHANGAQGVPFDFSGHMRRLCADVASRCEPFHHIDASRLLFGTTQARTSRSHGLQAKVTPMRFHGGQLTRRRRGRTYQVQRYWVDDVEMLYLVTFCLPRFLDQSFDDKFVTIFHELYHIAPEFDGDLRRHGGRYCLHTHSQKGYDRQMAALAREYLSSGADPALHAFLRLNFDQLQRRHGDVIGTFIPVPKLVPVP
jgi:predicted metallopeptidase